MKRAARIKQRQVRSVAYNVGKARAKQAFADAATVRLNPSMMDLDEFRHDKAAFVAGWKRGMLEVAYE